MRRSWLRGRLWHHPDFLKLWTGHTVSRFGSQITFLAVPTLAILALKATPLQVGLLTTLEFLAFPILGLFAGVYADRWRRRPVMIAADLGRAITLASIPIAFSFHALTLLQLYAVALLTGIFTVFFDISDQSYLPALVDRGDLVEGNTKLTVSYSTATLAGPAVAGFLIELVGGALAVLVDAVSFVMSAVAVWSIRRPEAAPAPATLSGRRGLWPEMREGLKVVFDDPAELVRHPPGQPAPGNHPRSAAGTDERDHAHDRLGDNPDRRLPRRSPGLGHRCGRDHRGGRPDQRPRRWLDPGWTGDSNPRGTLGYQYVTTS